VFGVFWSGQAGNVDDGAALCGVVVVAERGLVLDKSKWFS